MDIHTCKLFTVHDSKGSDETARMHKLVLALSLINIIEICTIFSYISCLYEQLGNRFESHYTIPT